MTRWYRTRRRSSAPWGLWHAVTREHPNGLCGSIHLEEAYRIDQYDGDDTPTPACRRCLEALEWELTRAQIVAAHRSRVLRHLHTTRAA